MIQLSREFIHQERFLHGLNGKYVYTSAVLSGPICAMLGLEWADVLRHAGLHNTDVHDKGFLVSGPDYVRLWMAMDALSNATGLSSELGQRMAQGPAIPILFAISAAPNFEVGIARMAKYKHLFGPMRFAITREDDAYCLQIIPDGIVTALPETFSSAQIVFLHAKARTLATREFFPTHVSLPLPECERKDLAALFGKTPEYGQPRICYAPVDVRIPFISQNDDLWAATEEDLQTQSLIMSGESPIAHRVRATLLEAFATTQPTLAHVSARLGTSKSTLLRRLRTEGQTFQGLLDSTRSELAGRYLASSNLNNQQIAHLLGYRDASAFQRAFRKWTGQTPQQLRGAGRRQV